MGRLGELPGGDEPPGQRRVAADVGVGARSQGRRLHLVVWTRTARRSHRSCSRPGRPACWPWPTTGAFLPKRSSIQARMRLGRAGVHPRDQAEGEEVLASLRVAGLGTGLLAGLQGQGGHRDLVDREAVESPVGQGVVGVARLAQRPLVEGVGVDDRGSRRVARRGGWPGGRPGSWPPARWASSPGVRMSWSEMWTWNADTPARVPAGARISAGKSGRVARSLPIRALTLVNRSPVSCMPSPESPAKRMTTLSRSWVRSVCAVSANTSPFTRSVTRPYHVHFPETAYRGLSRYDAASEAAARGPVLGPCRVRRW